jgi:hypothetical protein
MHKQRQQKYLQRQKTYTVHKIRNVDTADELGDEGAFSSVEKAIARARALGTKCSIWIHEPGYGSLFLCEVLNSYRPKT